MARTTKAILNSTRGFMNQRNCYGRGGPARRSETLYSTLFKRKLEARSMPERFFAEHVEHFGCQKADSEIKTGQRAVSGAVTEPTAVAPGQHRSGLCLPGGRRTPHETDVARGPLGEIDIRNEAGLVHIFGCYAFTPASAFGAGGKHGGTKAGLPLGFPLTDGCFSFSRVPRPARPSSHAQALPLLALPRLWVSKSAPRCRFLEHPSSFPKARSWPARNPERPSPDSLAFC